MKLDVDGFEPEPEPDPDPDDKCAVTRLEPDERVEEAIEAGMEAEENEENDDVALNDLGCAEAMEAMRAQYTAKSASARRK